MFNKHEINFLDSSITSCPSRMSNHMHVHRLMVSVHRLPPPTKASIGPRIKRLSMARAVFRRRRDPSIFENIHFAPSFHRPQRHSPMSMESENVPINKKNPLRHAREEASDVCRVDSTYDILLGKRRS